MDCLHILTPVKTSIALPLDTIPAITAPRLPLPPP